MLPTLGQSFRVGPSSQWKEESGPRHAQVSRARQTGVMPSLPPRNFRHAGARTAGALLALSLLASACSGPEEASETSTTTAQPREVAAPTTTETTTTTTTEPPIPPPMVIHATGSIRSAATIDPAAAQDRTEAEVAPVLATDQATIASLGCAPSTGCATNDLASLAANRVDALNLATRAATVDGIDSLESTASTLAVSGISTFGYGATIAEAATPVIITADGRSAAILGFSASSDVPAEMIATETTPGILAGPDALEALTEQIELSQANDVAVIVFIDWALLDARAPTEDELATVEELVGIGADVVIGHGSDFLQRFERVDETWVAHSLGNAVTSTEQALRRDTALLRMTFDEPGTEACLLPAQGSADGVSMDNPDEVDCS